MPTAGVQLVFARFLMADVLYHSGKENLRLPYVRSLYLVQGRYSARVWGLRLGIYLSPDNLGLRGPDQ